MQNSKYLMLSKFQTNIFIYVLQVHLFDIQVLKESYKIFFLCSQIHNDA